MRVFRSAYRSLSVAASTFALLGTLTTIGTFADAAELHEGLFVSKGEPTVLKRLPAGRDELMFRGEATSRTWTVALSASEAAHTANFQLAMLSSVVVLPDRSTFKLTINGRTISALPIEATDKPTIRTVKIPAGVLTPGQNKVQVSVVMTHRVDCSIAATYELWVSLDPAQTGIMLQGEGAYSVRSFSELAAEPLAEDGAMHIHLRLPSSPDAASIDRGARLIDAIVRRAGLFRPIVDVGPGVGKGPGFDVVIMDEHDQNSSDGNLRILGREGGVTFGREPTSNRLVIVLSDGGEATIDAKIAELEKSPAKTAPPYSQVTALDAGGRRSFSELGFATENFFGRHYLSSVGVTLPADFLPASDERVRLFVDGTHSSVLDDASELIFRVNGVMASSLPFAAGRAERYNHRGIDLPMRLFRPGYNEVSLEGVTTSGLDQQCDAISSVREPRLTISGASEIVFPQFAHLTTEPQISTSFALAPQRDRETHIYLSDTDPSTLGAALTTLANMAVTFGNASSPVVHFTLPADGDAPGLVLAPIDELPDGLAAQIRELMVAGDPTPEIGGRAPVKTDAEASFAEPENANLKSNESSLASNLASVIDGGKALVNAVGLDLALSGERARPLAFTPDSVLVAALPSTASEPSLAGIDIPRLSPSVDQWLVITAQRPDAYVEGVERLVSSGKWALLGGQASAFDMVTQQVQSVEPTRVSYVMPSEMKLSDIRPILGGVFSDNMLAGVVVWLALITILGVSTHALIRRMGVR